VKRQIRFVTRYAIEDVDRATFYVLAAASKEFQKLSYDRDVFDAVCRVADEADYIFKQAT
jgi:hypothetical protein